MLASSDALSSMYDSAYFWSVLHQWICFFDEYELWQALRLFRASFVCSVVIIKKKANGLIEAAVSRPVISYNGVRWISDSREASKRFPAPSWFYPSVPHFEISLETNNLIQIRMTGLEPLVDGNSSVVSKWYLITQYYFLLGLFSNLSSLSFRHENSTRDFHLACEGSLSRGWALHIGLILGPEKIGNQMFRLVSLSWKKQRWVLSLLTNVTCLLFHFHQQLPSTSTRWHGSTPRMYQ